MGDLFALVLENLGTLLGLAWTLALFVYGLKIFLPQWDQFTRFGKLESEPTSFPGVPTKTGWISFYSFSLLMFFGSFLVLYPASIANVCLFFHSLRRLLESFFVTKFTNRKMHFVNLLAGLTFYAMTPVTLAYSTQNCFWTPIPSILAIPICLVLNTAQFLAHLHLASLRKYTIPHMALFHWTTAPHYAIEMLLYLCYFMAAPHAFTFLMLVFVVFNLSDQSIMTHRWYTEKFGGEFTKLGRAIVFPFLY
jgi:3-oxo-5-alpha-steroid 4-dehydrogenase 3